jgi:O-antigen/teichoic acid export membrane protein
LSIGLVVAKASNSALLCLVAEALVSFALVQTAIRTVFLRAPIRMRAAFSLALRRLQHLRWRSAAALLSVALVSFALLNADRWIAAEILTGPKFAQYTFAWTALVIAQSFQAVINTSLHTVIARRFASYGRRTAYRISAQASCVLLVGGAVLAVPAWLVLDASIVRWFSEYDAARILLPLFLGIAVVRVSDFWSSFMVVLGLEALLLRLNVVAVIGAALVWLIIVRPWSSPPRELWEFGLLAALLTLANYSATAIACWYVSKREVGERNISSGSLSTF